MASKKGPFADWPAKSTLGKRPCAKCGMITEVKVNAGGHAYAFCIEPNGGCGYSVQCRGPASSIALAREITEWTGGNKAKAAPILACEPAPAPAPNPAPSPAPSPAPVPDPEPEPEPDPDPEPDDDDDGDKMWWDE